MPRTSNKAQMIVDYVNQFIQENGYSPSVREIGEAVGLRSTGCCSPPASRGASGRWLPVCVRDRFPL